MIKPCTLFSGVRSDTGELILLMILVEYSPRPRNEEEEKRKESVASSIFMILYDRENMYGADDELMYHGHTKTVREKFIQDLHSLNRLYDDYHPKSYNLHPTDYVSKNKKHYLCEMNYMLFQTTELFIQHRNLRLQPIESSTAYLQMIQNLRTQEWISNRHHRKLKDFLPFLPKDFLTVHTPTLSL